MRNITGAERNMDSLSETEYSSSSDDVDISFCDTLSEIHNNSLEKQNEEEENDQGFDNNLYLVGVLDQDLINGWEVWMTGLMSKEFISDFTETTFGELMEKCAGTRAEEIEKAIDGNIISKPPTRRAGLTLKNERKRGLLVLSRKQWKSLAHVMNSLQSNFIGGAEAWIKKIFQNFSTQDNETASWTTLSNKYDQMAESNSTIVKKWITLNHSPTDGNNCFVRGTNKCGGSQNLGKIRIEIKVENQNRSGRQRLDDEDDDEEDCLKLDPDDWIRIKVAMFSVPLTFYQMEIDLVQSFVCATKTDRCRRRIAKVVKREVIPEINWEKGVNAAGKYFAVHWNRFQIPELSLLEQDKHEKFELNDFEYELRLRFFSDDELDQTIASACSFPLYILENNDNGRNEEKYFACEA